MNHLKTRLREIARDRGNDAPDGRYFESLLGLSSGRISQIFADGSVDSLGPKSIRKLTDLGYSASWVLEGKGDKFSAPIAKPAEKETIAPDVTELIAAYLRLSANSKARVLLDIKYLADREEIDSRLEDNCRLPPITTIPKGRRVG